MAFSHCSRENNEPIQSQPEVDFFILMAALWDSFYVNFSHEVLTISFFNLRIYWHVPTTVEIKFQRHIYKMGMLFLYCLDDWELWIHASKAL